MKALEEESRRLKRMYAELSMLADLLKDGPVTQSFRPSLTPQNYLLWKKKNGLHIHNSAVSVRSGLRF
jgi:hypothetical protein